LVVVVASLTFLAVRFLNSLRLILSFCSGGKASGVFIFIGSFFEIFILYSGYFGGV